ncbi:MAG: hypothetical protein M3R00_01195 [Pseudomonadota bacterium]|nr:hypothetical protein [Pseudomonadota bacterium]
MRKIQQSFESKSGFEFLILQQGNFDKNPTSALSMSSYQQWLGYAFERFCRKYHRVIAAILGFSAVKYRSGVYFKQGTDGQKGFQIDLLFDRDDKVITVCEIRYLNSPVSTGVIADCEERMQLLPNQSNKTIHRVLISNYGPSDALIKRAYFDRFILIDDLFNEEYW